MKCLRKNLALYHQRCLARAFKRALPLSDEWVWIVCVIETIQFSRVGQKRLYPLNNIPAFVHIPEPIALWCRHIGLKLTLAKYVDVPQLVADLNAFDSKLLNLYATNTVGFCDGNRVALDQSDTAAIFASLSNRIYKTRNALVHSKEGSKAKFVPFTDDRDLIPEVPLMRFIAEQIIVATSVIPG